MNPHSMICPSCIRLSTRLPLSNQRTTQMSHVPCPTCGGSSTSSHAQRASPSRRASADRKIAQRKVNPIGARLSQRCRM
ncbi:hypothetical protein OROGR_004912 [Orobanche gracilis]